MTLVALPGETMLLSFKGLMADNPYVQVSRSIASGQRFVAWFTILQRVEATPTPC
jgi:hypothetical protein